MVIEIREVKSALRVRMSVFLIADLGGSETQFFYFGKKDRSVVSGLRNNGLYHRFGIGTIIDGLDVWCL